MFTESRSIFLHCISPVHMGAGTAVGGLIDNPIQREKHTGHPLFAGSGLKGAIRHRFSDSKVLKEKEIAAIFGPESNSSDHAGSISFSDAQLVAFPIRSLKNAFVYATCPASLARAKRQLELSGVSVSWKVPSVQNDQSLICNPGLLSGNELALESYQFSALMSEEVKSIAEWLAGNALAQDEGMSYFREKIQDDLVVLSDTDFSYFINNSTVVEPHVRIDSETGTADGGGLFYTENLPPESLLLATLMASKSRKKAVDLDAAAVVEEVMKGINGNLIQVGGDATTGRGQVLVTAVQGAG